MLYSHGDEETATAYALIDIYRKLPKSRALPLAGPMPYKIGLVRGKARQDNFSRSLHLPVDISWDGQPQIRTTKPGNRGSPKFK